MKNIKFEGIPVMYFVNQELSWECIIIPVLENALVISTLMSVLSQTVERYIAVEMVPQYKRIYTNKNITIQLVSIWLTSLALSLFGLLFFIESGVFAKDCKLTQYNMEKTQKLVLYCKMVCLVLILIVVGVSVATLRGLRSFR